MYVHTESVCVLVSTHIECLHARFYTHKVFTCSFLGVHGDYTWAAVKDYYCYNKQLQYYHNVSFPIPPSYVVIV